MNKYHLVLGLIVFFASSLKVMGQKSEPVIISAIYQFRHINDLNHPDQTYQQEMILRIGKTVSNYSNYTEEKLAKQPEKKVSNQSSKPSGVVTVGRAVPTAFVKSGGIEDVEMFQYIKENKIIRTATIGMQDYSIEIALPKIDWKIFQESKNVGKYSCQKAVGSYAGRTYTAWFASSLPFQNGPWKLSGLPGLILEAIDSKNEVMFSFLELNKGEEGETTETAQWRMVKVSEQAYERAKKAFELNPVGGMRAQLPNERQEIQLIYEDVDGKKFTGEKAKAMLNKEKREAKNRRNNPMELFSQH